MTTALVVASPGLTVDAFSQATGLHPDLVERLVALGTLDARRTAAGELGVPPAAPRPPCPPQARGRRAGVPPRSAPRRAPHPTTARRLRPQLRGDRARD